AGLPGVADGDEPAGVEVAGGREVVVLRGEHGVEPGEERAAAVEVRGALVEAEGGEGVQGRLGDAGGVHAAGGSGLPLAAPEVGAGEVGVAGQAGVEDDVRE